MSRRRRAIRAAQQACEAIADQPPTASEHLARVLSLHSSLDTIARGSHPGRAEWDALADVVNQLQTLAARDAVRIEPGMIDAVEGAMAKAGGRYKAGRPLRMDGEGLSLLRECVEAYLLWAEGATRREITGLATDTAARIRVAVLLGGCKVVDMRGCA
jgi:hypothetical protein